MAITGRGRFNITATDRYGNVRPSAIVEIRTETGLALTGLFEDRDGLVGKANPLITDLNGYAYAYAPAGHYQITITYGSEVTVWRDVPIGGDDADNAFLAADNVFTGTTNAFSGGLLVGAVTGRVADIHAKTAGNTNILSESTSTTQYSGAGISMKGPASLGDGSETRFTHAVLDAGATSGQYQVGVYNASGAFVRSICAYNYTANSWQFYTNGATGLHIDNTGAVGINGIIAPTAPLHVNGAIRLVTYTVGTLPNAAGLGGGSKCFVNDALSPSFGALVAAGGSVTVPVYSAGGLWYVG